MQTERRGRSAGAVRLSGWSGSLMSCVRLLPRCSSSTTPCSRCALPCETFTGPFHTYCTCHRLASALSIVALIIDL
eukprot:scaffold631220_cov33-Prasinocladus_malaysianus.AAC.1